MDAVKEPRGMTEHPVGFKGSEEVSPDVALGRVEGALPSGMKFYIRKQIAEMAKAKNVRVSLYKMDRPAGAQKDRRTFIAEFPDVPEDADIQALRPEGGRFKWFGSGYAVTGEKCEWMSEEIFIEPSPDARPFPSAPNTPPPHPTAGGTGRASITAEEAEEAAFNRFERMLRIVKEIQGPQPLEAVSKAMDKLSTMVEAQMERAMGSAMRLTEKVRERAIKDVVKTLDEPEEKRRGPSVSDAVTPLIPDWLLPWMPKLEVLAEKLMGGGLIGTVAAKTALANKEVVAFFKDEERTEVLAEVLVAKYGEEKAMKAFETLLANMPEPKADAAQ